MPERMPREGRVVGNYQLLRVLGKGGFAEVYLGKHIHLNTYAAVKLLRTHMDRQAVDKFRREARLVAQLRHPHIISITDFGVAAGVPYLVMDYAPGGTLRQLFPVGTVVDPLTVLDYLVPIAEALDYAHSEHIVHRDVKPENMLVGSVDNILLSDFGIAAVIADSLDPSPQTVAGTTAYMAPEQLRGRSQYASDQYALGIVAYEWLCGERPFRGSFAEVAAQHLHANPPSLRKRNPNIPPALEEVIMIALSKQPAQRFPSVGDFVSDFERALRRPAARTVPERPISARPTRANPALASHKSQRTAAMPAAPRPAGISRRTALAAVGVLAVAGTGALYAYTHSLNMKGKDNSNNRSNYFQTPPSSPSSLENGKHSTDVGRIIHYHNFTDQVSCIAWYPNQSLIACGCYDSKAYLWNSDTSNVILFQGHKDAILSITWAKNGKYIATGSADNTIRIWDNNGNTNFVCLGHAARVFAVSWSPDGKYIASGSADKTVRIWDAESGNFVSEYTGHMNWVRAVEWSPDGSLIASAGHDGTVQVWDVTTKKPMYVFRRPGIVMYSLAWSPSGTRIASGTYQGTVDVWDAADGGNLYSYTQHSDSVLVVKWSPDSNWIASGSADNTTRVWNALDGSNTFNFRGHNGYVDALAWSSDSKRIASGSVDKVVLVWQAA